jgi:hypothetical protein
LNKKEIHLFLRGGLGNQLFQYALGLHISTVQKRNLIIREDLTPLKEDKISGISRWPNQLSGFGHIGATRYRSHQPTGKTNFFGKCMQLQRMLGDHAPRLLRGLGVFAVETSGVGSLDISVGRLSSINGYAESAQFAVAERKGLVSQLHSLVKPSPEFRDLAAEMKTTRPAVIHLRLGDYADLGHVYGSTDTGYITEALSLLAVKNSPVWVFTQNREDMAGDLLEKFGHHKIIDSSLISSPLENMLLMSMGKALVCSNSTLSWWAAYLHPTGRKVVAPFYPGKKNVFSESMTMSPWRVLIAGCLPMG